jgi:hypothetical protein
MKEKNHFVWRHYLKPWTDGEGLIFCRRERKFLHTGTTVLANERFFYKLNELTEDDLQYIKKIFCNEKNIIATEINTNWLSLFKLINELIKLKEITPSKKIQNEINIYVTEFNENLHTVIENSAHKYFEDLYSENIQFYETEKGNIDFNIFLCEQFFRTKRMKESIITIKHSLKNFNIENCWNVGAHILAINLALTLYMQRQHFKSCLLKNDTDIPFITSGQPVINLAGDINNPRNLTINEFEFYYPITPKTAFILGKKDFFLTSEKIIKLNEENVRNYNAKMKSQCPNLLFSNTQKEL